MYRQEPPSEDPDHDAARSAAIVAVVCAGGPPLPPRWLQVELLAAAQRAATGNPSQFRAWLEEQTRLGGDRENAALVAAMSTALREETIATYCHAHPDRSQLVEALAQWI